MMPEVARSSPGRSGHPPYLSVFVFSRNKVQIAAWALKFTVIVCVKNHVCILFHFYTNPVKILSPMIKSLVRSGVWVSFSSCGKPWVFSLTSPECRMPTHIIESNFY